MDYAKALQEQSRKIARCNAAVVTAVTDLQTQISALDIRLNQLEKAHNRLCHLCGGATEETTIDQDNWASNEMGAEND